MAVLGHGGQLRLKREAPEATVLRPGDVQIASKSIFMRNPAFWSGDQVTLSCINGLPFDISGGGPDCPDGYGTYYGGDWFIGTNRDHIVTEASNFYDANNAVQFYMRQEESGITTSITYYIYRDQLDRISFYPTRAAAFKGATAERATLYKVDFNALIISSVGTAEYANAIAVCSTDIGTYAFSDVQDEVTLASICDYAPDFIYPTATNTEYDNMNLTPRNFVNIDGGVWTIQTQLTEWALNLTAPEVDITSVGEKFGDSVKSLVTGGGTMDFLIDRLVTGENERDSTVLLNLLLLTEKGCKAQAEFYMIVDRPEGGATLLPGDLFYETELLVTSVAVNTRATDIIAGSLNFVTVGEIALRMGTN
jgi:hypothetical protein